MKFSDILENEFSVSGNWVSLHFVLQCGLQFGLPYKLKRCKEGIINLFWKSPIIWLITWRCQQFDGFYKIGITTVVSRYLQWQNWRKMLAFQCNTKVPNILQTLCMIQKIGTLICSEYISYSNDLSLGAWCLPYTLPINLFLVEEKEGHNIFHPIFAWWCFYDLWHIPVDLLICFRSLDFLIFGLLSNRICNIFHDFFYLNFKQTLRLGCRNSEKQYEAANFLMNVSTTAAISLLRRCNLAWRVHQNGWLTVPVQAAQQWLPRQRCSACALGVSINCITPLICWIILVLNFFKILVFPYATHIGRKDTTAVFLDYSLF